MNSVIIKMAAQVIKILFLGISLWLLFRGHNYPGGGFIGGLIAGSALVLSRMAFETDTLPEESEKKDQIFFIAGMLSIFISMIAGVIADNTILKGMWLKLNVPGFQESLKMGTPILFDVGVYLTVIGVIFLIYKTIMEEWLWK
jgi:multicomponent Na+:H+ antiporter subunit B